MGVLVKQLQVFVVVVVLLVGGLDVLLWWIVFDVQMLVLGLGGCLIDMLCFECGDVIELGCYCFDLLFNS